MAQQEQDREDLFAEATALVERVELVVDGVADPVVIGFRHDGCASVYFGGDPVFHFNTRRELRRAYAGGQLYKAQRGRLISLQRKRTDQEVQLLQQELDDVGQTAFLAQCQQWLARLRESIEAGTYRIIGQVPADCDVVARAGAFLKSVSSLAAVASSPHAR